MPARILLVRHGQIEANRERVWHGSTDSALTEEGRAQARRVAAHLARTHPGVAALYTSPLTRARDTALEIGRALKLEPRLERDLAEYDLGELEGASYRALFAELRFFERIQEDPDHAPRGGESPNHVRQRMVAALERISRGHPSEEVVVVGHGAAIAIALATLLADDVTAWQSYHKDNCGLTELVLEPEPRLVRFNLTGHLEESG